METILLIYEHDVIPRIEFRELSMNSDLSLDCIDHLYNELYLHRPINWKAWRIDQSLEDRGFLSSSQQQEQGRFAGEIFQRHLRGGYNEFLGT